MCTAGVRCGRWDLGMTSVQFPSYYRASQVGATREEFPSVWKFFIHSGNFRGVATCVAVCHRVVRSLVRGEVRIFRYEMGGTWGVHRSTPVWGPIFAFSTRKSLLTHSVPWCKGGH